VAIDTTKIRAFQNGLVACSAYGVTSPTLPTDATSSLGAQFFDVGSVTDDGITDSTSQDTTDVYAWQGNVLVASLLGQYTKTFKVAFQETNGRTLSLMYPGSTLTQTGTGVTIAEKPPVKDVRAWVLHGISDSGKLQRIVIPLGQVSERGDVVWSSKDITVYELTIKCFVDASGNVAYRYHYDSTLTL
jgi:hypothetical protein